MTTDLRAFVEPDGHGDRDGTYHVRSLYFDGIDLPCVHDKLEGLPNRYKLRLRAYINPGQLPAQVKFEIKHRRGELIRKEVTAESLPRYRELLQDLRSHSLTQDFRESSSAGLIAFFRLKHLHALLPVWNLQFRRQAFSALRDRNCRITFDDGLVGWRANDLFDRTTAPSGPIDRWFHILEIKMATQMPYWLSRLVSKYRLQRTSVSKYVHVNGPTAGDND